jgi:hypothetical protein
LSLCLSWFVTPVQLATYAFCIGHHPICVERL